MFEVLLDDIAAYLVAQGVGTLGANIILGSRGQIPTGDGPYLSLTETGGSGPTRVHNKTGANTRRPSVQICVRAKSYRTARTMIETAFLKLDGVYETTLNGTRYHSITADQDPNDIGLDENQRPMIVFNVSVEKQP